MQKLPETLAQKLCAWYDAGHRELPWRQDTRPYPVWLSEIMLQQTRVEAVKGYYARFLRELPTIEDLSRCPPDRLTKLWEGLGYYSRVRNLQKAAQVIQDTYGGCFPETFEAVRALPGIGDYTAGAICSICFGLPTPAVDGNVLRVLSRVMEDEAPITNQKTKNACREALVPVYQKGPRGTLTQALMELGAMVCVPNGAPRCESCPLREICLANLHGTQDKFPVKEAKRPKREEHRTVFVLQCEDALAVRKRPGKGLLAGLWELPNVEGTLPAEQALAFAEEAGCEPFELQKSVERTHVFTHIIWKMRCYYLLCREKSPEFVWAGAERRRTDVALPTAFRMFVED